jgi:hypothetical protein
LRPKPDGGKGRFDGVGGAQVRPVFGRKVVEGKQHIFVFLQALAGLGILELVVGQEPILGFQGFLSCGGQVHVMEQLLGAALQAFGQFIEHVGRLMHPATLRLVPRDQILPGSQPPYGWAQGECAGPTPLAFDRAAWGRFAALRLQQPACQRLALAAVRYWHSRWPVEQGYQQMKEELGLDHFEGRSWHGFHRHAVLVMMAYGF